MRVDAHHHFWRLNRGDYGWITPESSVLYRDYLPTDLISHLAACNIDGTVVVQAAPTVAETEYLLDLAEGNSFIKGVVGWLDLESPGFEQDYRRLRQRSKFVGVRPMLQDLPEDDWVMQDIVIDHVRMLEAEEFPIDILVFPRHLPYIIKLLESVPDLRAVIDHLAKPDISNHVLHPWRDHIREIASHPAVMCKVSGMVTEADHENWVTEDFRPYVNHAVEVFGPSRLMFGSDWPVCRMAAHYEEVYGVAMNLLEERMTDSELDLVFGENAQRFYRLEQTR